MKGQVQVRDGPEDEWRSPPEFLFDDPEWAYHVAQEYDAKYEKEYRSKVID